MVDGTRQGHVRRCRCVKRCLHASLKSVLDNIRPRLPLARGLSSSFLLPPTIDSYAAGGWKSWRAASPSP